MMIFVYIRRLFLMLFRRRYIREQMSRRTGPCGNHGCCEYTMFHLSCFDYEKRECRIWREKGYEHLPWVCKVCPIDEKDKNKFLRKHCSFRWK